VWVLFTTRLVQASMSVVQSYRFWISLSNFGLVAAGCGRYKKTDNRLKECIILIDSLKTGALEIYILRAFIFGRI
jgi:hypothetical protein